LFFSCCFLFFFVSFFVFLCFVKKKIEGKKPIKFVSFQEKSTFKKNEKRNVIFISKKFYANWST
jgi:hypothetical protein